MRRTLFLSLALAGAGSIVAAPIDGSMVFATFGVTLDDTNLLTSVTFTPIALVTPGVAAGLTFGDLSAIPTGTSGAGGLIDIADLGAFALNFVGYGTFEASKGEVVKQDALFAEFFFSGTFTPEAGGPLAGMDATSTDARVSLTKSGTAVSYSGTLATNPGRDTFSSMPEPETYAMIGVGLLAVWAFRRKAA